MNVEEKVDSFHRDGFVKLANIIKTQELETIQADTQKIVDSPFHDVDDEIDYFADFDTETSETIFTGFNTSFLSRQPHLIPCFAYWDTQKY